MCELTEIGERYYQKWLNILQEIAETENFIQHLQEEPTGELFISTPRRHYLIPYLVEFQRLYPHISLKIEIAERIPDFNKDKIDIILGMSFEPPPDVVRKKIGTTYYRLVGSPSYFAQHGSPVTLHDLTHHHLIEHYQRPQSGWIPFDNDQKIYCKPTILLNDTIAMQECALAGLGIARLQEHGILDKLVDQKLISVLEDFLTTPVHIYLYYPYKRYVETKLRCFIDFIVPRFRDL